MATPRPAPLIRETIPPTGLNVFRKVILTHQCCLLFLLSHGLCPSYDPGISCSDGGGSLWVLLHGLGWPPHACSDLLQENPAGQPEGAGELLGAQRRGREGPSQWLSWRGRSARAWSLLPRGDANSCGSFTPSRALHSQAVWDAVVTTAWCLPLQLPFHRGQVSSGPEGFLPFIGILYPPPSPHQSTLSCPLLVAQVAKNRPAIQETWVGSLGGEDPMEDGMAMHPGVPEWEIPWTEEPGGLQLIGLQRVRYDWSDQHFGF